MEHQRIQEQIAAYALDAVGPDTGRVEQVLLDHLPGCSDCSAMLRDLREVAADLGTAVPPRPVSRNVEVQLFAQIREEAVPRARERRFPLPQRLLAVAAALVLVASGALNVALYRQADQNGERARMLAAFSEIVSDPAARSVKLAGREGQLALAWHPNGEAVLVGHNVPAPPSGRVLELWLLRDGAPVPVRTFVPRNGNVLLTVELRTHGFNGAAITVERGFVRAPTTNPIYAGTVADKV